MAVKSSRPATAITEDESDALEAWCALAGMSVSGALRLFMLDGLKRYGADLNTSVDHEARVAGVQLRGVSLQGARATA
ncbi:MAG TPA: hypothetical protein VM430_13435 [Microbacterium sp.]|nr:hypothetical protein [Microbacterium sp.]